MKHLSVLLFALCLGISSAVAKDIKTVTFYVEQLLCENCEAKIMQNIPHERGVKDIVTDIPKHTVSITYDADKTDVATLQNAFTKFDFKAELPKCDAQPCNATKKDCCKKAESKCAEGQCDKSKPCAAKKDCCKKAEGKCAEGHCDKSKPCAAKKDCCKKAEGKCAEGQCDKSKPCAAKKDCCKKAGNKCCETQK